MTQGERPPSGITAPAEEAGAVGGGGGGGGGTGGEAADAQKVGGGGKAGGEKGGGGGEAEERTGCQESADGRAGQRQEEERGACDLHRAGEKGAGSWITSTITRLAALSRGRTSP